MKNIIRLLVLVVLAVFILNAAVLACTCEVGAIGYNNSTGEIIEIKEKISQVVIQIDFYGKTKTFNVHPNKIKELKVGDKIRVLYSPAKRMAINVKKVTQIEPTRNYNLK